MTTHVSTERGLSLAGRRLLAIVAYYAVAATAIGLAWRYSPGLLEAVAGKSAAQMIGVPEEIPSRSSMRAEPIAPQVPALTQAAGTLAALGGALATALPVALVYSLTRRRKGFAQSMVHLLLLLPIAVAGMVVLIQHSLALAFSLAGIVAVLRFRNSLEDVKDGVFVFVAVSIGMSAAVGALAIGLVTSAVFNACVLVLWWLDFARRATPDTRPGWRKFARLPKVAAPPSPAPEQSEEAREAGDAVFAEAARAWRRQLQITSEFRAATPTKSPNASLLIRSSAPDAARPVVEQILGARAKRWELTGIVRGAESSTLKYRIRVKRGDRADFLDAIRNTPGVDGVELR
ncbi:MAG: DUF4956 domain-containing protein [Gemmatimonadaceae bacterium]